MVTLLLAATLQSLNVEIVKRSDLAKGFVVLPAVPWPPPASPTTPKPPAVMPQTRKTLVSLAS
jgi:hypothetical protein